MTGDHIPLLAETYVSKLSSGSKTIYITTALLFVVLLGALPLIPVQISITCKAIIRPSSEVTSVRSLIDGRVSRAYIQENQIVEKADTLFVIDNDALAEKIRSLKQKIESDSEFCEDLAALIETIASKRTLITTDITTELYHQSRTHFISKLNDAESRQARAKQIYNRNKKLHTQAVIPDAEFENYVFELRQAGDELELTKQQQLTQWQSDHIRYKREMENDSAALIQLLKEEENLIVTAPIKGTIQNLSGIYHGTTIFSNQELAQISPDTTLIIESYVSPADIGLLRPNMNARYQIDAFNYNQWGMVTGKITEISNDIVMIDDKPVFKVYCKLDKNFLQLKNGYKGLMKKGMTLNARFQITERTLWQLLYDKVDDWLNPNVSKT